MRSRCLLLLSLFALTVSLLAQSKRGVSESQPLVPTRAGASGLSHANPNTNAKVLEGYGKLPLAFEANQGQADPQVKFLSRGAGYSLFLTGDEAVLALQPSTISDQRSGKTGFKSQAADVRKTKLDGAILRMKLLNANPKTEVSGQDELAGKSNYFIGNDPKKWRANVAQFEKVRYENVYSGVDLVYYGHQRELEYDFALHPGADPSVIRLGIKGAKKLRLERGELVLTSAAGEVRLRSPRIYQEKNGFRNEVHGGYVIKSKNEVGFSLGRYDRRRALVIDPVVAYSTFLGGSSGDSGFAIAVDSNGNAYVTGYTQSTDFPVHDAILPYAGGGDAFVAKFNPDGSGLIYSTYLGGSNLDRGNGIALDSAGNVYVTGTTYSTDFPVVNAIQPTYGEVFVTKINAAGSGLVYSTYLGGDQDLGLGVAVDSTGNAYVTGQTFSAHFPTANAIENTLHGASDAFVSKINPAGSAFVYSTYLGGGGDESGNGIATDSSGNAYVVGRTNSANFPTKNPIQAAYGGNEDGFVTEIKADGSAFVYSTYLGGSDDDEADGVAADSAGNAYVTGFTWSANFPTSNALQPTNRGGSDAFVTKFNAGGRFAYSTYLGGSLNDSGSGIAVDSAGNAYVTGKTASYDFPVPLALRGCDALYTNTFVTSVNTAGALAYSTCWSGQQDSGNGIAVDLAGSAYVAGDSGDNSFPTTAFAFQQSYGGNSDAFLLKIAGQTFVGFSPTNPTYLHPTLVFGKLQVVGTTGVKKLTMTNHGPSVLTINKMLIAGLNSGDFSETNNCGNSLAAGASCVISMAFTPTGINKRQGILGVSDSDPASPDEVYLSGTGTVVSLSKLYLSFGDQPVGTTSGPGSVTLTNVGNTQLNFFSPGIVIKGVNSGDFQITGDTCLWSIPAKASCTVTVAFTPTAIGARKAVVYFYDYGGGSPQKVALTGTGT